MTGDRTEASRRWDAIERLYHQALDLPADARTPFLDEACAGDDGLRAEVASLLAHDEGDDDTLEQPAIAMVARALAAEHAGTSAGSLAADRVLGHYRLVRRIGRGGMGEVFLADDLSLHRRVALKFLPPDLASDQAASARLVREARAVSALAHPNIVTVHSIDTAEGLTFIVMEYVEGETLRAKLDRGPAALADVISAGAQVAEALAAAHAVGLIHRDIKPANIVITPAGQAKVLDFGIAKRWDEVPASPPPAIGAHADMDLTATGVIHGTVSYMSPEQARGEPLEPRADIFSLGAVLYEAVTGARPFTGPDTAIVLRRIQTSEPQPPSVSRPGIPAEFDQVIGRAMAKQPDARYESANDFAQALRNLNNLGQVKARHTRNRRLMGAAVLAGVIAITLGIQYTRNANREWAAGAAAEAAKLAVEQKYEEAFELVTRAQTYLPQDANLERMALVVTDDLSVVTTPAGARAYLTKAGDDRVPGARRLLGTTPIAHALFARGDYLLEIEKDGFAPLRRMVSSALVRNDRAVFDPSEARGTASFEESPGGAFRVRLDAPGPITITVRLMETANVPKGMVFVPGGPYRLVAVDKPVRTEVRLADYFIDQFEVSNSDYREFIRAAGHPAPRSWINQDYAESRGDHPVTDITWHDASAYASYRGTQLPTVFQWEKAARDGQFSRVLGYVMPWGLVDPADRMSLRANLQGTGTVAVQSFPFGISPFGAAQMAGNAAEWCRNPQRGGYTVAGGSWQDPLYLFGQYGTYPERYTSAGIGFRTVKLAAPSASDQGAMPLDERPPVPTGTPVNDATYRGLLSHYQYDPAPLNAQVTNVSEGTDWRRERITFAGEGGERADAYLYLPKNLSGKAPVLHYVPSDAVIHGLTVPEEVEALMTPLIRAGRAVFAVVNRGFSERPVPVSKVSPDRVSVGYREVLVNRSIDLQRGLDYLATRADVDMTRLAAFGTSIWSAEFIPFAIERRYRAIVFLSAGLPSDEGRALPEANALNFIPRLGAPILMLVGRHDESLSYETSAAPLFARMPEPKSLRLFDGGHIPPLADWVPVAVAWLDQKIGVAGRR